MPNFNYCPHCGAGLDYDKKDEYVTINAEIKLQGGVNDGFVFSLYIPKENIEGLAGVELYNYFDNMVKNEAITFLDISWQTENFPEIKRD